MAPRVAIVGAGVSGLAAAWHLRHPRRVSTARPAGHEADTVPGLGQPISPEDLEIVVFEKERRPGGTAWTEYQAGFMLELGPNGFLDNKPSTLELCSAVGLNDALVRADESSARRFVLKDGRLCKLPASPGEFLRSDLLSWRGKLRVLAERLVPPRRDQSDESVYDFGCRRIGREATETLLDAFVTGIIAGDYKLLSLPACFPRMVELEQVYGGLLKAQFRLAKERRARRTADGNAAVGSPGGKLTAPRGGMRQLVEALARSLGPDLRLGTAVHKLEETPDGWVVHADSESVPCDAVILASPSFTQAEMLKDIDPPLAEELAAIEYTTAVVAVVGYRRDDLSSVDANGFGYLAPQALGRPVLGVLWSSSIFPQQAPAECFQFRAILGGWRRRDVFDWTDEQILAAVRDDLLLTLGITAEPCFSWVYRWPRAIPQYHLGHRDRLGRIEDRRQRHPGLFLTGNAFRGVSLNDCTADAARIASTVAEYLRCGALNSPLKGDRINSPVI